VYIVLIHMHCFVIKKDKYVKAFARKVFKNNRLKNIPMLVYKYFYLLHI
jgi:hypothetical protein